ncbi:unnamed protein product, partial [Heterosigma akashiwo]
MAVSLACKLVETDIGFEEIVWVCIVDERCQVLCKQFFKPVGKVADHVVALKTGIEPFVVWSAPPLSEVRPFIAKILEGRLVIGHSVLRDLDCLGIHHPIGRIWDVGRMQKKGHDEHDGRRSSLKELAWEHLGVTFQQGTLDPEEDAFTTMHLYKKYRE